jgi:hypothetical protein
MNLHALLRASAVVAACALPTTIAVLPVSPAAAAPSCIGQFFSSHAGLGAAHTGETVGTFTSATARELGREFGAAISGARTLPRDDCGL